MGQLQMMQGNQAGKNRFKMSTATKASYKIFVAVSISTLILF